MKNGTPRKTINVDKPNRQTIYGFKELDNAVLRLSLYKNSIPFDVEGQTIRLGAKTSKGIIEQVDGFTINANELDIELKNSILVPGVVEIDLELKDANGIMTTASFFITVESRVLNDTAVQSTNEFDTFSKTVAKVEEDYNSLRRIIIDENQAANLQDQVNKTNAQLEQIEIEGATKTEINNIQQQLNNLVLESGGDSNLEVVQARGGEDTLNARLDKLDILLTDINLSTTYEIGGINSSGANVTANNRVRTQSISYGKYIIRFSNCKVAYRIYNNEGVAIKTTTLTEKSPIILPYSSSANTFRIIASKLDDSEITDIDDFLSMSQILISYDSNLYNSKEYTNQKILEVNSNIEKSFKGVYETVNDLTLLDDFNNAIPNRCYVINTIGIPNQPVQKKGTLITFHRKDKSSGGYIQKYVDLDNNEYNRIYWSPNGWSEWNRLLVEKDLIDIDNKFISFADISLFERIGVIGDSWCSGYVYPNGKGENRYNISWCQIMGRKHGVEVTNFTKGGLRCDTWLRDDKGLSLLNSDTQKQLYIIALGINDTTSIDNGTLTLGSLTDIDIENSNNNSNTFYGYYGKIVSSILKKAPKAKIILATIPRDDKETYSIVNNAIIEIAGKFNIPKIITLEDDLFNSQYFKTLTKVNNHPTSGSYSGMAEAYSRLISKCMVDNYEYFMDYYGDI